MSKYEVIGVLKQDTQTLEQLQDCCRYELDHFDTLDVSTDDVSKLNSLLNEVSAELVVRNATKLLNHKR